MPQNEHNRSKISLSLSLSLSFPETTRFTFPTLSKYFLQSFSHCVYVIKLELRDSQPLRSSGTAVRTSALPVLPFTPHDRTVMDG